MLTPAQQKWVDHLSDTDKIKIFPYDPTVEEKFQKIKFEIQSVIGTEFEILHRGASALGISGQKEIDIYIPMPAETIEELAPKMEVVFGKPKSVYVLERTKFIAKIDTTKIEIMLTNQKHQSWIDGEKHFNYLKQNPEELEQYRKLKEDGDGVSVREYYRRKIEYINEILSKVR
jgi:GrpB-like predicted nucleotidyltransferase (UPF0157 family)